MLQPAVAVAPAVRVRGLRFTYKGAAAPALDGVDLTIQPGEFVVLMGPSGAGKSTLCYCLNGLIPHFLCGTLEGEVSVFGQDPRARRVSQMASLVGMVFQDFEAQLFSTNVELEVAFAPENFAVPLAEMRRRVARCLALTGLTGLERREPATLSGGQKQRLAIASVLSMQPPLLVMDEPTTDLDPEGKGEVLAVARRLCRERGITVLVAEHESEEAVAADRVVVLDRGRIAAEGTPAEVLSCPDSLESLGVQPLGAAQLLVRLGEPPALTAEEAAEHLRRRGYRVRPEVVAALARREEARHASYGEPIIQVRGLVHTYPGGVRALDGVDLTVRRGEFLAIAGQNGSGKTTLALHLNGLLLPTAGEVRVKGASTRDRSVLELSRVVGYVFQNPDHQIFAERVWDEVAFGPRNFGVPPEELPVRVREALAAVGLEGKEEADPFVLTRGERQRVAVASVLATRPEVIILDEPTTGLDYREQRRMMELVRALNQRGHTIIVITHTMWLIAEYAHRTVVMREGRIVLDGPTRQVMGQAEVLAAAALKPPQVARCTGLLGGVLLTVDEAVQALRRG